MFRLGRLGSALSPVAIGLALTLAGTGIAAASSDGLPQQGTSASTVAERTAAAVTCHATFAVVNKFGVLQRAGCPGTSSKLLAPGHFQVLFPHNEGYQKLPSVSF